MGLVEPVTQAHMSKVVNDELTEIFWALEDHWQVLCKDKHVDLDHLVEAKHLYQKLYSICRLIGLDPASLSNLGCASDKPIYPPTRAKADSIALKPRATAKQGELI